MFDSSEMDFADDVMDDSYLVDYFLPAWEHDRPVEDWADCIDDGACIDCDPYGYHVFRADE